MPKRSSHSCKRPKSGTFHSFAYLDRTTVTYFIRNSKPFSQSSLVAHCSSLAPPFCSRINAILHDVVLSVSRGDPSVSQESLPSSEYQEVLVLQKMKTPFTERLAKYGYDPHENDQDSDSELEC